MQAPLLSGAAPMGTNASVSGTISSSPTGTGIQGVTGSGIGSGGPSNSMSSPAQESIFARSAHPTILFFHLFFRTLAIAFYMFGWLFTTNFVTSFVVIILLLSFDFWTVKNVTGRLLVGLRWWNEIREDGENVWIFESREGRAINATDANVFWFALYAAPAIWFVFGLGAIIRFSFQWTLCVVVALVLNMANVVGYSRCHKDYQSRMNQFTQNQSFMQGIVTTMVGNSLGSFFGSTAVAPTRV